MKLKREVMENIKTRQLNYFSQIKRHKTIMKTILEERVERKKKSKKSKVDGQHKRNRLDSA